MTTDTSAKYGKSAAAKSPKKSSSKDSDYCQATVTKADHSDPYMVEIEGSDSEQVEIPGSDPEPEEESPPPALLEL